MHALKNDAMDRVSRQRYDVHTECHSDASINSSSSMLMTWGTNEEAGEDG